MAEATEEKTATLPTVFIYDPKPSLRYASAVGLQAAVVGTFVSAIQNALGSHSRGAAGFFTRTGGTIGFFGTHSGLYALGNRGIDTFNSNLGAIGATFAFTDAAVANYREKDDALNGAAGGCAAGFLAGLRGE